MRANVFYLIWRPVYLFLYTSLCACIYSYGFVLFQFNSSYVAWNVFINQFVQLNSWIPCYKFAIMLFRILCKANPTVFGWMFLIRHNWNPVKNPCLSGRKKSWLQRNWDNQKLELNIRNNKPPSLKGRNFIYTNDSISTQLT